MQEWPEPGGPIQERAMTKKLSLNRETIKRLTIPAIQTVRAAEGTDNCPVPTEDACESAFCTVELTNCTTCPPTMKTVPPTCICKPGE